MIEERELYPVTLLLSVDDETLNKLSMAEILLAKDFLTHDMKYLSRTGLRKAKLKQLISEAGQLVGTSTEGS